MRHIYLGYNANTPIDPAVATAMKLYLGDYFGNPSSGHWAATRAAAALEEARGQAAVLLGCASDEIIFTSGGSEANNLALKGVAWALKAKGDHIITSAIEHPAIVGPCRFLKQIGFTVSVVRVDRFGRTDPDDVRRAITPRTVLGRRRRLLPTASRVGANRASVACASHGSTQPAAPACVDQHRRLFCSPPRDWTGQRSPHQYGPTPSPAPARPG
jgi:glutamate/tyrosine decarboxylase-like PLP-dependent enzyme